MSRKKLGVNFSVQLIGIWIRDTQDETLGKRNWLFFLSDHGRTSITEVMFRLNEVRLTSCRVEGDSGA
jgi:hypothetical protein